MILVIMCNNTSLTCYMSHNMQILHAKTIHIAPEEMLCRFFNQQSMNIFVSVQKHMLWVLNTSASVRRF